MENNKITSNLLNYNLTKYTNRLCIFYKVPITFCAEVFLFTDSIEARNTALLNICFDIYLRETKSITLLDAVKMSRLQQQKLSHKFLFDTYSDAEVEGLSPVDFGFPPIATWQDLRQDYVYSNK